MPYTTQINDYEIKIEKSADNKNYIVTSTNNGKSVSIELSSTIANSSTKIFITDKSDSIILVCSNLFYILDLETLVLTNSKYESSDTPLFYFINNHFLIFNPLSRSELEAKIGIDAAFNLKEYLFFQIALIDQSGNIVATSAFSTGFKMQSFNNASNNYMNSIIGITLEEVN